MAQINIIDHPLIKVKLTKMRDKDTNHTIFSQNLDEIASLMAYEILRDCNIKSKKVKTPTDSIANGFELDGDIVIVPILRAGLGMVSGIQKLIPTAKIGHIGIYRDEKTFLSHEYFYKMPQVSKKDTTIIVVDPMLATGVSSIDAIKRLEKDGFKHIKLVCLVGSPEGVKNIKKECKDIKVYLAALDEKLNEKGYIIPGLGDAGDRIFGTK